MDSASTSVDSILVDFIGRKRGDLLPSAELRRIEAVVDAVRACLTANAGWVLTSIEAELLAAERELDPDGDVVSRVATPDALLMVMPTFVADVEWRPADLEQRRFKISICKQLCNAVIDVLPGEELGEMLLHIETALGAESRAIRAAA